MRTLLLIPIIFAATAVSTAETIIQKKYFDNLAGSQILSFKMFDTTKGTLTSVETNFSLTITGGILIIDNDGPENAAGTLEFGTRAIIESADVNLAAAAVINHVFYSQTFELAENSGDTEYDYDPTAPDGTEYIGGSKNQVVSGFVDSTKRHEYTGTENYDITVTASPWIDIGQFDNVKYYASSPVNNCGYVEIIYTYQAVPEPTAIGLLAAGTAIMFRTKRKPK